MPSTDAIPSSAAMYSHNKLERSILWDFLIAIALLVPIAICEFGIEPARRGFYCDDTTIRYPFQGNTVSAVALGLLVVLPALFLMCGIEYMRVRRRNQLHTRLQLFCLSWPLWLLNFFKHFAFYAIGLVLTFDATEVGKYTIGRLRPHFISVCQPQLLDGSTCMDSHNLYRYVENYVCQAEGYSLDDVRQTRLSFPSGHSSLSFYAMTYLVLYLQRSLTWQGSRLARHFLQFWLLMLAWFTALSRVMDSWHHWSDVLVGALFGVVGALLTAIYIAKYFCHSEPQQERQLRLPRQDTAATLQEVLEYTPPPYTLKNMHSYSVEQLVTKI